MRHVLLAVALALLPVAASAGDAANRTLIGFSADGAIFAFMESGVQDGSGFPYANVYFVDVASNSWAEPPVAVRLDDEAMSAEGAAVAQAMRTAWPVLEAHGISTPARLLWSQPLTESRQDGAEEDGAWPGSVTAGFTDGRSDAFTLTVSEVDMPDGECGQYGADITGFALTLKADGANAGKTVYADDNVPESRGCALGYSLSDVLEGPTPPDGGRSLVALVNVFKLGFEGWDRRFIAVPFMPADG